MLLFLQTSQGVNVPVWAIIVSPIVLVSGTLLVGWWNRKRRSSVRAEEGKLEAEAEHLKVQSISSLLVDLKSTRAELASIIEEAAERSKESRRRESFLRDQLEWHEDLSIRARKAAHAAINEVQRCVFAITLRDQAITEMRGIIQQIEDLLTSNAIIFTKTEMIEVPVFEAKSHEAIVDYESLPLPPETK